MNQMVSKHLFAIHSMLTDNGTPLSEERWQVLNDVAAAPFRQNENYYYIYRSVAAKAAKLGCEMVKRKPFEQQNELTAVVAALTMLEVNGIRLADYRKDIDTLRACFASNDVTGAEAWLEQHRQAGTDCC